MQGAEGLCPQGTSLPAWETWIPEELAVITLCFLKSDLADTVWLSHANPPLQTLCKAKRWDLTATKTALPTNWMKVAQQLVWITVSGSSVPQIQDIAEVRHPHFSWFSSAIAHCSLKHTQKSVFLQKWSRSNLCRQSSFYSDGWELSWFCKEHFSPWVCVCNSRWAQTSAVPHVQWFLSEFALWVHCGGCNLFCQRGKYVFICFNRKYGPKKFFF